jgi:hypothetical protein
VGALGGAATWGRLYGKPLDAATLTGPWTDLPPGESADYIVSSGLGLP